MTLPSVERFDVVLAAFPHTDLARISQRPAVVLTTHDERDVILAFVTLRLREGPFRVRLQENTPAFEASGLHVTSDIRADRIATLSRALLARRLGTLDEQIRRQLQTELRLALRL